MGSTQKESLIDSGLTKQVLFDCELAESIAVLLPSLSTVGVKKVAVFVSHCITLLAKLANWGLAV